MAKNKKPVTIGERLQRAREEKGLPKTQASKQIGIARQTYILWERDAQTPGVESARAIAEFTGDPVEDILTELLRLNGYPYYDVYPSEGPGRGAPTF